MPTVEKKDKRVYTDANTGQTISKARQNDRRAFDRSSESLFKTPMRCHR